MTTTKRYTAYFIIWDEYDEEYVYDRALTSGEYDSVFPEIDGWDTLDEFTAWFNGEKVQASFQDFRVTDEWTDEEMTVFDGVIDDVLLRLVERKVSA